MLKALTDYSSSSYAPTFSFGTIITMLVLYLAIYALTSWTLGKMFQKAGIEAWKAWVPIYNLIILFKMGDQNPLFVLFMFVPVASIVGTVFMIIAVHNINLKLGRGGGSTALYVFLPFVWMLIVGFGPDRWRAPRVIA